MGLSFDDDDDDVVALAVGVEEDVEVSIRDFGRLLLLERSGFVNLADCCFAVDSFFAGFVSNFVAILRLLIVGFCVLGCSICFRSMGCCFRAVFVVVDFVVAAATAPSCTWFFAGGELSGSVTAEVFAVGGVVGAFFFFDDNTLNFISLFICLFSWKNNEKKSVSCSEVAVNNRYHYYC